jgi:hypothetical protein
MSCAWLGGRVKPSEQPLSGGAASRIHENGRDETLEVSQPGRDVGRL